MIKGKNLRIKVAAGTVFHATECTVNSTLAFTDIATKDTSGTESSPDEISWTMNVSSIVAHKDGGSTQTDFKDLIDSHLAKELVAIEFTTDEVGEIILTGNGYIESYDISSANEGFATFSASIKGNGIYTAALVV